MPAGASVLFHTDWFDSGLPDGCGGYATLESEGGRLLAVLVDMAGQSEAGAYTVPAVQDGGRRVLLPRYCRNYGPHKLSTVPYYANLSQESANLKLTWRESDGTPWPSNYPINYTIPPGAFTYFPPAMPELPDDFCGTLEVESDQPIAVLAKETSFATDARYLLDTSMYMGTNVDAHEAIESQVSALPLLLHAAESLPESHPRPIAGLGPLVWRSWLPAVGHAVE
jgi:hypothetical protein